MTWADEKEEAAKEILILLYQHRMIRTFSIATGHKAGLLFPVCTAPCTYSCGLWRLILKYLKKCADPSPAWAREEAPDINRIIGIAMAGVPIAAGMALAGGIPVGFTRKMENVKSAASFQEAITRYGEHSLLEGELVSGDRIALVDDLVTRFDSKEVAAEQVKYEIRKRELANIECKKVIVVLDREQGGAEAARRQGIELLTLISFKTAGLALLENVMNPTEWETLRHYLDDPQHFQQEEIQKELACVQRGAE